MKKYELTSEYVEFDGRKLYRIKALKSFYLCGLTVKAGALGGYIEKEENLSQEGNAWIHGNAYVYDNAYVRDNAYICEEAWIHGNAEIKNEAWIHGNAEIGGNAKVKDEAEVYGDAELYKRQKEAEAKLFEQEKDAAAIEARGQAESRAIQLKGEAEAKAMDLKAEAMKKYGDAAITEMIVKILPDMAKAIAEPISSIDKVTVIGGDSNGVSDMAGNVPAVLMKVMESMKETTGVDLKGSKEAKTDRNITIRELERNDIPETVEQETK